MFCCAARTAEDHSEDDKEKVRAKTLTKLQNFPRSQLDFCFALVQSNPQPIGLNILLLKS